MNEWELWKQEAQAKQGDVYPERLMTMHKLYGVSEGHTCRGCRFLVRVRYSRVYLKCSKNRMTHGAATDWKAGWPACGLYEEGE